MVRSILPPLLSACFSCASMMADPTGSWQIPADPKKFQAQGELVTHCENMLNPARKIDALPVSLVRQISISFTFAFMSMLTFAFTLTFMFSLTFMLTLSFTFIYRRTPLLPIS